MRPLERFVPTSFMTLACLLGGLALAIAQGPSPAEDSFWESIKASTSAAEFRAYLEAFPKGFYADRARQRIAEIDGTPPPSLPSPGPQVVSPQPLPGTDIPFSPEPVQPRPNPSSPGANPGGSVLTSYEVIREVQERLYGLNYNIKMINGQLTKETREAISAWQQVVQRPVTGDMMLEDLEHLRTAVPIATWGAIGFEARGAYGMVWSRPSRPDAEADAMAECVKYAKQNGKDCQIFTLGNSQCAALSWYQGYAGGRQHWGAFVVRRGTYAEAQNDVLEECRRQAKAPKGCQVRAAFCADGSHKQ